jgi:hypothetical protein
MAIFHNMLMGERVKARHHYTNLAGICNKEGHDGPEIAHLFHDKEQVIL